MKRVLGLDIGGANLKAAHSNGAARTQREFFARTPPFTPEDFAWVADYCAHQHVDFLCTPFDLPTIEWLDPLVPAWKVASADITNAPLLERLAWSRKPILLSTGASTLHDIHYALGRLADPAAENVCLMHCVLSYPTYREDANLLAIQVIANQWPGATMGYSDHTIGTSSMDPCFYAYLLGARIIEKHFTDDVRRPGNDHYHSMRPRDLQWLRTQCTRAALYLGTGQKAEVAACERPALQFARRGLYAAKLIPAGQSFTTSDVMIWRPAARLGPEQYAAVLGTVAQRDYQPGEPL